MLEEIVLSQDFVVFHWSSNFKAVGPKHMLRIKLVDIAAWNVVVPSGNRPEPMLTKVYNAIWRY